MYVPAFEVSAAVHRLERLGPIRCLRGAVERDVDGETYGMTDEGGALPLARRRDALELRRRLFIQLHDERAHIHLYIITATSVQVGLGPTPLEIDIRGLSCKRAHLGPSDGSAAHVGADGRRRRQTLCEDVSNDDIPDARDGLTRKERVVLWTLARLQAERGRRDVPLAMLYGRVLEHVDLSTKELQEIVARLGARR